MKFGCPARSGKAIPRASFQTFVTAIYFITHFFSCIERKFPTILNGKIRKTSLGIEPERGFQRFCRAGIQATATTAATVLLRCVVLVRFEGGDDFSQEEERAFSGNNQVCVLPDPSQSGFPGPIAFEDGS